MRVRCLATVCLALLAACPTLALDAEENSVYPWRIVLHTSRHPVLNPTFRDQLSREIQAALQGTVGPVAEVSCIDLASIPAAEWEPLWKQFDEKGWSALEPASDRTLTGIKTHFLRIEYKGGQFHLEARQHDGFTDMPTPMLRKRSVRSTDMVSRLAAMMLEPDFCPTGTIDYDPDQAEHVFVNLRGSGIGSLERYVRLGSIFAVARVRDLPKPRGPGADPNAPTGLIAQPQDYTLLKVIEPIKGTRVKCQVLTRWLAPFGRDWKRMTGLRCMKLPTVDSPVNLLLVGRDGIPHARGTLVQVAATDTDFRSRPGQQDAFEFRDGLYRSGRSFNQVACVQVALGAGRPQQFPIPVVSTDPVVIRFDIRPEDEERAMFERACNDLRNQVGEAALAQVALFKEVSRLIDNRRNRDALNRAETGLAAMEQTSKVLSEELQRIQEDPKAEHKIAKEILTQTKQRLDAIAAAQQALGKRITDLQEAVKKSNDPIRIEKEFREKELAERIKEFLVRGDVDDALKAYDDLITLRPMDQELKDRREQLQREWAPRDEEHRKARESFRAWTQAKTAEEFREALGPLREAAEVFLRKRDRFGLRKMLNLLDPAAVALRTILDEADTNTEQGVETIKTVEDVINSVRELEQTIRLYIEKLSEKTGP